MRFHHLAFLSVFVLGVAAKTKPGPADLDEPDLICHGPKPEDCYPRTFVPTNEFQIVHDDQVIPKGLHIRMSMQTGEKEAKLVDPSDDRLVNAVEITSDEPLNAVEVIPDEPVRDEIPLGIELDSVGDQAEKLLDEMRKAKAAKAGAVKPPMGSTGDREAFERSMDVLRAYVEDPIELSVDYFAETLEALDQLEDLCHDIYWGQELMKDRVAALVPFARREGSLELRSRVSRLFATALRNNAAGMDILEGLYISSDGLGDPPVDYLSWALELMEDSIHNLTSLPRPISHISVILSADRFHRDFIRMKGPQRMQEALAMAQELAESQGSGPRGSKISKDLERASDRARNLLSDHYLSEYGKQRIKLWGRETEKNAESLGWLFDEPQGRTKRDLDALCIHFAKIFDLWQDVSTAVDQGQGPPADLTLIQYEPNVCKSWRTASSHLKDKSEL